VKALGLLVEGRAQVSMNLTNFRQTPIARVVEMVRREAERYGVGIRNSELVGLVPQEALVDAAVWYTQLDRFEPEQILEHRLQKRPGAGCATSEARLKSALSNDLAKGTPTPGGGSASAFAGSAAAALVSNGGPPDGWQEEVCRGGSAHVGNHRAAPTAARRIDPGGAG
jgi:glutamate formiminotransferase / formiminotetrahydrofolate cyclodeaminase